MDGYRTVALKLTLTVPEGKTDLEIADEMLDFLCAQEGDDLPYFACDGVDP